GMQVVLERERAQREVEFILLPARDFGADLGAQGMQFARQALQVLVMRYPRGEGKATLDALDLVLVHRDGVSGHERLERGTRRGVQHPAAFREAVLDG